MHTRSKPTFVLLGNPLLSDSMFVCLDLGFAMLCALCGLVLVSPWGHLLCVVAFVPPRACFDVTTCKIHLCGVSVLDSHLSPLHAMFICLPCLLGATGLGFFASFASLHACLNTHA